MISPKKLENVLKKLKNWKGSQDQITADVLGSIASRMFGEIGEIVVVDVLGFDFPGTLAVLCGTIRAEINSNDFGGFWN